MPTGLQGIEITFGFFKPLGSLGGVLVGSMDGVLVGISSTRHGM